jgi:hypothetical protein
VKTITTSASRGLYGGRPTGMWQPTAALVIEIVSPGDESWEKLPFYAAHDVEEVLIVDPQERSVTWLALEDGKYRPVEHSLACPVRRAMRARAFYTGEPRARDTSAMSCSSWRWRTCSRRSNAAFRAATRSAAWASTSNVAFWFSVSQ